MSQPTARVESASVCNCASHSRPGAAVQLVRACVRAPCKPSRASTPNPRCHRMRSTSRRAKKQISSSKVPEKQKPETRERGPGALIKQSTPRPVSSPPSRLTSLCSLWAQDPASATPGRRPMRCVRSETTNPTDQPPMPEAQSPIFYSRGGEPFRPLLYSS